MDKVRLLAPDLPDIAFLEPQSLNITVCVGLNLLTMTIY
jgi:hypothetical protein